MRTVRNHYEILGLQRSATPAQIKRKYREMVRKFHPDVAKDKDTAHRLFLQINESYEVLSDPVRRKAYDETLDLDAQIASRRASQASASQPRPQGPRPTQRPTGTVGQLLKDAQFAFIQRRLNQAKELCKEALKVDPRNARACAMIGDICKAQGKREGAIKYYNLAIQFNPADRDTEKKLFALVDKQVASSGKTRDAGPAAKVSVNVNAFWWTVAFLLLFLIHAYPGRPIPWLNLYIPRVNLWSWNLVFFMAAASAVGGAMLSVNGLLRHPDEELLFGNIGSWLIVPGGIIFFPVAAGLHIVFNALLGSLSKSVLTLFALVTGIVLFAAAAYVPQARVQVLLFGGNIAFLSSLFGWYTGAALKPLGAE